MRPRRFIPDSYHRPGKDSAAAKADATLLLFGTTDAAFDRITPESLARDKNLSLKVATYMLTVARQKREAMNGL